MGGELVRRGAIGGIVAAVVNVIIGLVAARLLDVPDEFQQLRPGPIIFLTLVGAALATLVYALVQRRSERPERTFVKLAIVALIVSWLPDLVLWRSDLPGVTTAGVLTLMALHLVAAVIIVVSLTGQLTKTLASMPPAS